MTQQHQLFKSRHLRFRYSLLALSIAACAPAALAQENDTSHQNEEQAENVEVITVTGSRIRRTDLETHTPVMSIGSDEIEATGTLDLGSLLNELPSMAPTAGMESSNANGYAGLSRQNLRGLGTSRTLVLVNGRRHVPSVPGTSEVDISSIPTQLVERVDVLTGGASSIYGADAVSGVINIILKNDFVGTEVNAGYNVTGEGDGETWHASLTHGRAFSDNKGFINFHVGYQTSNAVEANTRSYVANDLTYVDNPAAGEPGQPDFIIGNRSPLYSSNQRVFLKGGRPHTLDAQGNAIPMMAPGEELFGTSTTQLAALTVDSSNPNFYSRYNWGRLAVPSDKLNLNLNFIRELTPDIKLTGEFKYVNTQSESRSGPLAEYGVTPLPADYSFYTDEQRAEVASTGQGLLFGGSFPEMGRQGSDFDYDLYQGVIALEGYTDNNYRWQVSAQHGRTEVEITNINDYSQENWEKAVWGSYMDPETYEYRYCGADCTSINVFQPLSQDAVDYLKIGPHSSEDKLTQTVLTASLDGDLFALPAGYLGFATGLEHRREKSESTPSNIQAQGLGANNFMARPLVGEYDVSEAFVELNAPILRDYTMAESLDLNGAWRTAKYSTAGTNHSWTVGLDWMPTDSLKIRASRAKAARAPNISEIYQTESQGWDYVYEVCYSAYRQNGSEYRDANCNERGLVDPPNYYNDALIVTSGNEDLTAERAYTFTGGIVYSPDFVDGLDFTVDYWDINLVDKIGTLTWSQVYPNCMDSPSLDNVFCDLIEYHDSHMQVNVSYLNLAKHETRGVDYALNYNFDLPATGFDFVLRTNWSRLLQRDLQSDANSQVIDTVGDLAYPKWRGRTTLTARNGGLSLTAVGHYIGSQNAGFGGQAEDYSVTQTGRVWYLDLGANYSFTPNSSVNLFVSNITGRNTPQLPGANTGGASWEMGYSAGLYTTLGRYISLSYRHTF